MAHIIADRVKETTTSAGTRVLTLAGAMTGFQTFASKCAVGDTLFYGVHAVDAGGSPTGEWECGLGTYTAANQLTMTTRLSSSTGVDISFAAGTKQIYITMPAAQVSWARERLTAARTYYVATTGSDSNDGRTVGTPFLTIQKAVDVLCGTIDSGVFQVTVSLADGTYAEQVVLKSYTGSLPPIIRGNATTPGNVIVNATGDCFSHSASNRCGWTLYDMKLQATSIGLRCSGNGNTLSFGNVVFGACATAHMYADTGMIVTVGNYSISGSATYHAVGIFGGTARITSTIDLLANITVTYFAYALRLGIIIGEGATFNPGAFSVTGTKYRAELNGLVFSNGVVFPGSIAGATATGGQYA